MDLLPADLLWSFFVSAATHYRKDSLLWPFPKDFLTQEGEKDFIGLLGILNLCPNLAEVNRRAQTIDSRLIKLLRWVLNPKNFSLKHVNSDKFEEIYRSAADRKYDLVKVPVPKPDYIFEVVPSKPQNERFRSIQGDARSLYAFHGTRVENYFSILNNGLRNNLNKVSLFGEGTYLTSDLSMALNYSPQGRGWKHSLFGDSVSCLAVCEMIDHPDVKCTLAPISTENKASTSQEIPLDGSVSEESKTCFTSSQAVNASGKRSRIKGSLGGDIPEEYFVVRNDDLIRVKYLFVYAPLAKHSCGIGATSAELSFFSRHQFLFSMLLYVFVLLIASVCGSKRFRDWLSST